jgi:hypothetical protein
MPDLGRPESWPGKTQRTIWSLVRGIQRGSGEAGNKDHHSADVEQHPGDGSPAYGRGIYRRDEVELILRTAFSGFSAVGMESNHEPDRRRALEVHTGFWGCGVYGGNKNLMTIVQILAARLARIETIVFHAVNAAGLCVIQEAMEVVDRTIALTGRCVTTSELLDRVTAMGLTWGVGDGN